MLTLHTKIASAADLYGRLVLPYDQREKCRLRARLDSGEEVAIFTVRGTVLRGGDLMTGADHRVVEVVAALEPTYAVRCDSAFVLARCAFHLGNRHTQVQIGEGMLTIRADPVLREMVEGLGASVEEQSAAFEPEQGAYAGASHRHDDHFLAPVPARQKIHRPGDQAPA
ncbi:urease accessory protein UreE [Massilia eurypsychrophila]|uniref:Urease accessory protein UreE n=1 Tax=Massilia eurypsychrophila TaxID=1485217 RepID=A0A2G8T965_9BURK|nr:urease accessory protein UreE [Massilia eurypsychrophila]PIL42581.1 urease accessory protein UreE [Massilia eurypsychrophila]